MRYNSFRVVNYCTITSAFSSLVIVFDFAQMTSDQIITVQDAFKKCATIRKEGLLFGEKNYSCVRADRNSIYAKTVS